MKKFKKHVSTEEEKKLIGYLTKKKRVKKDGINTNQQGTGTKSLFFLFVLS